MEEYRMKKLLLIVLLATIYSPLYAGNCYTNVPILDERGKSKPVEPVCKALLNNLNEFCDQPPMACELKIAPQFSKVISLPKWEPIDPQANRKLIEDFLWAPYSLPKNNQNDALHKQMQDEQLAGINAAFNEQRISFSKAKLDLYNLGKNQTAYRLDYGDCRLKNPQLQGDHGYTTDDMTWGSHWNDAISPSSVQVQQAPDVVRKLFTQYQPLQFSPLTEVFGYKGQTYSFWMQGNVSPYQQNEIVVNRAGILEIPDSRQVMLHEKNVCHFKYYDSYFTRGENK
jgi:hypothetical protein